MKVLLLEGQLKILVSSLPSLRIWRLQGAWHQWESSPCHHPHPQITVIHHCLSFWKRSSTNKQKIMRVVISIFFKNSMLIWRNHDLNVSHGNSPLTLMWSKIFAFFLFWLKFSLEVSHQAGIHQMTLKYSSEDGKISLNSYTAKLPSKQVTCRNKKSEMNILRGQNLPFWVCVRMIQTW